MVFDPVTSRYNSTSESLSRPAVRDLRVFGGVPKDAFSPPATPRTIGRGVPRDGDGGAREAAFNPPSTPRTMGRGRRDTPAATVPGAVHRDGDRPEAADDFGPPSTPRTGPRVLRGGGGGALDAAFSPPSTRPRAIRGRRCRGCRETSESPARDTAGRQRRMVNARKRLYSDRDDVQTRPSGRTGSTLHLADDVSESALRSGYKILRYVRSRTTS